ncbi:hypothetical protein [Paenibacillus kribbensis]|uniref:hypothetical protein n=1 Tax=Paenibacillus kribbensis TaxID=172713 RepID=UPI00083974F8|nr:hypothetical protein [Paenibacillus kribbensis]
MNIGAIKQGAAAALLEKSITSTEFSFIASLENKPVSSEEAKAVNVICRKINAWYFNYPLKGE